MKPSRSVADIVALPALEAAPLLIGCVLKRNTNQGTISIKIVETEAYHQDDPASHTFRGKTLRTAPMFERGGHLYVYFTYGMHYCLNIVTGNNGIGEAVLIRAGEPLEGLDLIRNNRNKSDNDLISLTNGPGKLAQALGINNTKLSGKFIGPSTIDLLPARSLVNHKDIAVRPRVGISKAIDNPWRFYLANNLFVSRT